MRGFPAEAVLASMGLIEPGVVGALADESVLKV
jgi:hypothetical protein